MNSVLPEAIRKVVVDALVYGSQQSSSSANGTITSPEIAALEGDQSQGGCIVVSPGAGRGFGRFGSAAGETNKSVGRFPDGADTDSNCDDFLVQNDTTLSVDTAGGADNIKVASVTGFAAGQKIIIDTGANRETAVIKTVGTAGGTTMGAATDRGATVIPVASAAGFSPGQVITIDSGANRETAVVASISGGRRGSGGPRGGPGGATITVAAPLASAHAAGTRVCGTGITLASALIKAHSSGAQVTGRVPTPGAPNQYSRRTP